MALVDGLAFVGADLVVGWEVPEAAFAAVAVTGFAEAGGAAITAAAVGGSSSA